MVNHTAKNIPIRVTGLAIWVGEILSPRDYFLSVYFNEINARLSSSQAKIDLSNVKFEHHFLVDSALLDAGIPLRDQEIHIFNPDVIQGDVLACLHRELMDASSDKKKAVVLTGGDTTFKAAVVFSIGETDPQEKNRYAEVFLSASDTDWVDNLLHVGSEWVIAASLPGNMKDSENSDHHQCALDLSPELQSGGNYVSQLQCLVKIILGIYFSGLPGIGLNGSADAILPPPFYWNLQSRSWMQTSPDHVRIASLVFVGDVNLIFHFSEAGHPQPVNLVKEVNREFMPSLILVAGSNPDDIVSHLITIKNEIQNGTKIKELSSEAFQSFEKHENASNILALIGQSPDEIAKEVDYALKGVKTAYHSGADWQTPAGSFFSPTPIGKGSGIAFVYPGAFNSYTWMAKDLLFLFPLLKKRLGDITPDISSAMQEKLVYPHVRNKPIRADFERLEAQLMGDAVAMLTSGTALSFLYTVLLKEIFEIQPGASFGYSLGETSMMFASGVWSDGFKTQQKLNQSPLFQTRLAGPQMAVQEYWRRKGYSSVGLQENLWVNYVLMCEPQEVLQRLPSIDKVYLTHINTPRQVVIGGHPEGCQRLIEQIKCTHLKAPFSYALHCEPVQSEYRMFVDLFTWPVSSSPVQKLYSAASYSPIQIDQGYIAASISRTLCSRLDFPRLINRVYQDGARCFIELGAGSNCSKWIDETLKGVPHLSLGINRKGLDDYSSLLRVLARLVSHKFDVNLKPLFR
jgi:PfaB family protein